MPIRGQVLLLPTYPECGAARCQPGKRGEPTPHETRVRAGRAVRDTWVATYLRSSRVRGLSNDIVQLLATPDLPSACPPFSSVEG